MRSILPIKFRRNCIFMVIVIVPLILTKGQSLADWKNIQTIDDICLVFPDRIELIMKQINLMAPGLEAVQKAYNQNQIKLACRLLLDYYQKDGTATYLRADMPQVSHAKDSAADLIMEHNLYTINNQSAKVPYKADGHIDWSFHGPTNDDEWAWVLNRHYHIETLFSAYRSTGNPIYAKTIDLHIKDWIIASLPYPAVRNDTEMWRGLEVHCRAKIWAKVFYGLNNTDYLSEATQLLLLSSIPEHAHYLRNFYSGGNWRTMEMSALATISTAWPEFKESPQWGQYAVTTMTKEIEGQVYPDGVHKELTSSYHKVALTNFAILTDICKQANISLSENYEKHVENMWNYLACTMRPNGYGLLNNDSDLSYNREMLHKIADQYRREDWKHIASNGEEGTPASGGPSFFFPWAGHLIMRSGYDKEAQWAFFDIGPCGLGAHRHNDKLHISISAYGRDFLVDAGRFSYNGEIADKFRRYACGSTGHNVILIDGKEQTSGALQAEEPLTGKNFKITKQFDYAWGSFDQFVDLNYNCNHSRALFHVRGKCWVVVDRITSERPCKIEALWHWHPKCLVNINNNQITTGQNEGRFLHVIPVCSTQWSSSLVKGRETPSIQGWYSREYNVYEPNTVSVYTIDIQKKNTLVWILYPSENLMIDIQAKIISENDESLLMQINHPKDGQWTLNIPFADGNKALMSKAN